MPEISIMPGIGISASGLDAESRRMEIIAGNVANAQTTRDENGKVFRRKMAVFEPIKAGDFGGGGKLEGGVKVSRVMEDKTLGPRLYRPGHPDAGPDGYVEMPNVNAVAEMVDMMSASRAFEANLSAMKTARGMAEKALGILSAK